VIPRFRHPWSLSIPEAEALQIELAGLVEKADRLPGTIERVAGADVAYEIGGDRIFGSVVSLDVASLAIVESFSCEATVSFPYVPGLFSFREIPPLVGAIAKMVVAPDLLVCDGQGIAHPRRFGLACHLGVMFDVPTIGCAKTRLIGRYDPPGEQRGSVSMLLDEGEVVGAVLRTQDYTRPVFVSIGHRISLMTACEWVLRLSCRFRLPEPVRHANSLANALRRNRDN
jgi:deoxyribonuclease V